MKEDRKPSQQINPGVHYSIIEDTIPAEDGQDNFHAYLVNVRFYLPTVPMPLPVGFEITSNITLCIISNNNNPLDYKVVLNIAEEVAYKKFGDRFRTTKPPVVTSVSSIDPKVANQLNAVVVNLGH